MISNKSIKRKIILTMSYTAVVVPTFLVALLAITYYYLGIEKLFSEKITESINDTVKVATLYLNEHNNNIKTSTLMAASDTATHFYDLMVEPSSFTQFLDKKAKELGLSEIVVFNADKKVIGSTSLTYSLLFENIEQKAINDANDGLIVVRTSNTDKVQALMRIDLFITNLFIGKVYILVGRYVDSKILQHLETTQEQADVFLKVKQSMQSIRKKVITAFVIIAVLFLLIAIFISKKLAIFIVKPIHDLSSAIQKFKLGKKFVKVQEKTNEDEINVLAKSFNKMIDTITSQHSDIMHSKHLIEERNHFIEAMMSELSAGVIVLNSQLNVEMSNLSALKILNINTDQTIINKHYKDILPEFVHIIDEIFSNHSSEIISSNISIIRGERAINLLFKAQLLNAYTLDAQSNEIERNDKIIVTLDDITAVVSGQRFQAWADIARRLAHEVKNPLTPIQLAVDRLEHKFLKQIKTDSDLFQKYIQIINSRVDDIKKMLTDFVEFAGISTLTVKPYEIAKIIRDVVFLQRHQWSEIHYEIINLVEDCKVLCEKMYITQVMTNLLKNAAESITSAIENSQNTLKGKIIITLQKSINENEVIVLVEDNGIGISADIIERICEPYVTTKATGTGLGLSIVKKIIEEHKGEFTIKNKANGGTVASFGLQIAKK